MGDEGAFRDYFAEQPWLALDYQCRKAKDQLSEACKVQGIPSLVIIDGNGKIISRDGREAVAADPTGDELPWHPKPVKDCADGPGDLNETAVVVALCDKASKEQADAAAAAMKPLAEEFIKKADVEGEDTPEISFM